MTGKRKYGGGGRRMHQRRQLEEDIVYTFVLTEIPFNCELSQQIASFQIMIYHQTRSQGTDQGYGVAQKVIQRHQIENRRWFWISNTTRVSQWSRHWYPRYLLGFQAFIDALPIIIRCGLPTSTGSTVVFAGVAFA